VLEVTVTPKRPSQLVLSPFILRDVVGEDPVVGLVTLHCGFLADGEGPQR
jgi:hypothetical protein